MGIVSAARTAVDDSLSYALGYFRHSRALASSALPGSQWARACHTLLFPSVMCKGEQERPYLLNTGRMGSVTQALTSYGTIIRPPPIQSVQARTYATLESATPCLFATYDTAGVGVPPPNKAHVARRAAFMLPCSPARVSMDQSRHDRGGTAGGTKAV